MHIPSSFAETRTEVLHELIEKHPFGILISQDSSGLDANHIPFELQRTEGLLGGLHCHVARANPVWKKIASGDDVLVVFRGENAYISPGWYPSKLETRKEVPTWNYVAVHAYGRVKIHDDAEYVRQVVTRLSQVHEAKEAAPWQMSDAPQGYIDSLLKAIVGIEIEITQLIGSSKLSQNKSERDIRNAVETLKNRGQVEIADAMLSQATSRFS